MRWFYFDSQQAAFVERITEMDEHIPNDESGDGYAIWAEARIEFRAIQAKLKELGIGFTIARENRHLGDIYLETHKEKEEA